eukprot:scaffold244495_cov19-Tisochrysis_lutea.AAC.1
MEACASPGATVIVAPFQGVTFGLYSIVRLAAAPNNGKTVLFSVPKPPFELMATEHQPAKVSSIHAGCLPSAGLLADRGIWDNR